MFSVKHNGNITFDEVVSIARVMRARSQSRFLIGTVKEILGTCMVRFACQVIQLVIYFKTFCSISLLAALLMVDTPEMSLKLLPMVNLKFQKSRSSTSLPRVSFPGRRSFLQVEFYSR